MENEVDIELNGSHVFVAGSPRAVTGRVRLQLSAALKVVAVETSLVGFAGVWFVPEGSSDETEFDASFFERKVVWKPAVDSTLPAGETAIKFDLGTLGACWPPSHEEKVRILRPCGSYVRYCVAVKVVTPLGSFNKKRWGLLTVVSLMTPLEKYQELQRLKYPDQTDPVDENEVDEWWLRSPAKSESTMKFGFPSFKSGSLFASISAPRRSYGFGEVIVATVHVRNSSSTKIKDVEVRITQRSRCSLDNEPACEWARELVKVSTGCVVEPGKEADVLVHLRVPAAATCFVLCRSRFMLQKTHTLDVDVRYKGIGRRLSTGFPIDLNSVPRGAEAEEWGQQRIAELVEAVRPCIPWKVYDSESDMLKGPHVQALCVPVDRAFASQRPLYGQTFVPEGEPLCDEPCFIDADTDPCMCKHRQDD
eukprot:m51a1_g211 hypothetical protein (421) ;mRNA; r:12497-13821